MNSSSKLTTVDEGCGLKDAFAVVQRGCPEEAESESSDRAAQEQAQTTTPTSNISDRNIKTESLLDRHDGGWGQLLATAIGNVLEWYDFAIYGSLSDIISKVFFPAGQEWALVETWAIFAGAFIVRPIGGAVLGYVGDVHGRERALFVSIVMMATSTFLMGVLPSYDTAGGWAIALLVLVRLGQGFSVGGELTTSIVYLCENRFPSYWGYYGSLALAYATCGTLLGSVVSTVMRSQMTTGQLVAYGWRIPFLAGSLVGVVGGWMRFNLNKKKPEKGENASEEPGSDPERRGIEEPDPEMTESSASEEEEDSVTGGRHNNNPFLATFACQNLRALVAACFVAAVFAAGLYTIFIWMPVYMTDPTLARKPLPNAFGVNSGALFLSQVLLFPMFGLLSDRFGRRILMALGGIGLAVSSPFLIAAIGDSGSAGIAFAAQATMGIFLALWTAPMLSWFCEAFAERHRLSSISIAYNVAMAALGGSSPTIATIMVDKISPVAPGYYLSAISVLGLTGLLIAPAPAEPASSLPGYDRITWTTLPCFGRNAKKEQVDDDSVKEKPRRAWDV